jgi:hypothetical protein
MPDYYPQHDNIEDVSEVLLENLSFLGLDNAQFGDDQFIRASASSIQDVVLDGIGTNTDTILNVFSNGLLERFNPNAFLTMLLT